LLARSRWAAVFYSGRGVIGLTLSPFYIDECDNGKIQLRPGPANIVHHRR
jgi:hypothetical protein